MKLHPLNLTAMKSRQKTHECDSANSYKLDTYWPKCYIFINCLKIYIDLADASIQSEFKVHIFLSNFSSCFSWESKPWPWHCLPYSSVWTRRKITLLCCHSCYSHDSGVSEKRHRPSAEQMACGGREDNSRSISCFPYVSMNLLHVSLYCEGK